MSAFKLVGRHSERAPTWCSGKTGTVAKKRVYITEEDFNKYAPKTAKRFYAYNEYDVEFYRMLDGGWLRFTPDWWKEETK